MKKVICIFEAGATIRQKRLQQVNFLTSLGDRFGGWVLNKVRINRLEKVPK